MKLLIHSRISTVQMLSFGNERGLPSHTLQWMYLLIRVGIDVNPCQWKGHWLIVRIHCFIIRSFVTINHDCPIHLDQVETLWPVMVLGPVSLRLMTSQFKDVVNHMQKQKTVKCIFCGVWVQNFVWNFKGALWNLTQNFEPTHRKICILWDVENLTTYDILRVMTS